MPLYEFQCKKCGREFEELIFGDEQANCPDCQATKVEKRLSVPAPGRVSASLPVCQPSGGGMCGLPQCGGGMCGMD